MGIDTAMFRNQETLAIGIGNFANEASALYMAKRGRRQFVDAAMATGFGPPTRQGLTFGLFRMSAMISSSRLSVVVPSTATSMKTETMTLCCQSVTVDRRCYAMTKP